MRLRDVLERFLLGIFKDPFPKNKAGSQKTGEDLEIQKNSANNRVKHLSFLEGSMMLRLHNIYDFGFDGGLQVPTALSHG